VSVPRVRTWPLLLLSSLLGCAAAPVEAGERPISPPRGATLELPAYGHEPQVELAPSEREALAAIRHGSVTPAPSGALVLAARELARRAAGGEPEPLASDRVRAALTEGSAFDPAPLAYLVSGDSEGLAELLARRVDRDVTHVGVGAEVRGGKTWLAALAVRRRVRLEAFPRRVSVGVARVLRGQLDGLTAARVEVTIPSGEVREVVAGTGAAFEATLRFEVPGRHVVEVLGNGPRGPEVAALFAVDAGELQAPSPRRADPGPDPTDLAAAEARVEAALNALRAKHGLPPLTPDPALKAVARRHSADMLASGEVAHVLPGTGDLRARLRRARIAYRRAMENVARGASALEAHVVAEESPGHRRNMLEPGVRLAGVGVARGTSADGGTVAYLTEIFLEPTAPRSAEGAEAEVRVALARARGRLGFEPLSPDPALDALARAEATRMARDGSLAQRDLTDRALELGRRVSASDAFLTASPGDAARTRHAEDTRFRRVGVGVAPDGPDGRLWMAVVYTD